MQMLIGLILAIVGWALAIIGGGGVMSDAAEHSPITVWAFIMVALILIVGSHAVWAF